MLMLLVLSGAGLVGQRHDPGPDGAAALASTTSPWPRRRWGTAAEIAGTVAVAAAAGWAVYRERASVAEGLRVLAVTTHRVGLGHCLRRRAGW